MSDDDDKGRDTDAAPKVRINKKMSLRAMAKYVDRLRLKGRMSNGEWASESYVLLEASDREALDDIAATLDHFYITGLKRR